MDKKINTLFAIIVVTICMLAACGGGNEKEASVPTLDVTFEEFKKKWSDDLYASETEGISSVVVEEIDISNLSLEGRKFSRELMKGFTLEGEVAENDKIISVSLTAEDTNEEPPDELEKVIERMQGAFMSYGLLIKSVNPELKDDDKPFEKLGIVDENGELVADAQANEEKSVTIKGVKYTRTKNGIRAEPAIE